MAVGIYRTNTHACAVCRWWTGNRTVDFNGTSHPVYVKADSTPATCMAFKTTRGPGSSCNRFAPWEEL